MLCKLVMHFTLNDVTSLFTPLFLETENPLFGFVFFLSFFLLFSFTTTKMKKILISCLLWIASAACQNTTTASSGLQTLYNRKVGFVIQDGLVAANQVPLW